MEQSSDTDKNQNFQRNVPNQENENITTTGSKAGIPSRPPQKRKRTNQKAPQKINSGQGSEIWYHFTKVEGSEPVKSTCTYCKKELCASGRNGTSAMWNHLDRCKKYPYRREKNQKSIDDFTTKSERGDGKVKETIKPLNVEDVRTALAAMIIIDELPFKIVEGEGFQRYSKTLEPRFIIPSRNTVARDCLELYAKEKLKLKKIIEKQRLCLTTDTWTSIQNLNYMCLTAHWIDDDWRYQKRILNFQLIESHAGRNIGSSIEECLMNWGIDSIFTVTVDNASSNDTCLDYLMKCAKWKDSILDQKYMHVRCAAHIVNLIVKEGLTEQDKAITRIRNAISVLTKSRTASVAETLDELYHEYKRLYTCDQNKIGDLTSNEVPHGMDIDECDKSLDFLDSQFEKCMESLKKTENSSELAKYLNEELIGKKTEFDILAWWKENTTRFPILSKLAKDVLAIPVSTVSSEQAFSTGGRVIDSFRSSLTPKTVEALVCAQNWLRSSPIDLRESLDYIEELEEIEEDCLNSTRSIGIDLDK